MKTSHIPSLSTIKWRHYIMTSPARQGEKTHLKTTIVNCAEINNPQSSTTMRMCSFVWSILPTLSIPFMRCGNVNICPTTSILLVILLTKFEPKLSTISRRRHQPLTLAAGWHCSEENNLHAVTAVCPASIHISISVLWRLSRACLMTNS